MIYLLAAFLLQALPFFLAGVIISIAYITVPQKSGLVYFASMAGSAVGAALPISLLPLAGEGNLIIVSASISLVPLVYSIFYFDFKTTERPACHRHRRFSGAAGILTFALFVLFRPRTKHFLKSCNFRQHASSRQPPLSGGDSTASSPRTSAMHPV